MRQIPVCKPILPSAEKLLPYLRQIDANRYYSNIGPLCLSFEERLATHFGIAPDEVVTSANGTLALVLALQALGARPGSLCVMPSWSFVATPAAARMAGLVPYFIDIDPQDWAIHPEAILPLLAAHDVGAVIPVAPFGRPLDYAQWQNFHETTGIPVVIDAAAGFDSFSLPRRTEKVTVPFMVSLHATKVLGIGEGAVIITGDAVLAHKIRQYGNFGFFDSREAEVPGINAKLSEYGAAVGLAALDEWPEKRIAWQQLTDRFDAEVKRHPGLSAMPGYNEDWVSCYGLVKLDSPSVPLVKAELAKRNIGERSWWGDGCHAHAAYRDCPHGNLHHTEHLAKQVLGLPFWLGLSQQDITQVFNCLIDAQAAMPAEKKYA